VQQSDAFYAGNPVSAFRDEIPKAVGPLTTIFCRSERRNLVARSHAAQDD